MTKSTKPLMLVLSSPSGAGKTTLSKKIQEAVANKETKFIITGGSWGAILSLLYTIQYPNDIQLPKSKYNKSWGTWAGEPIGYVSSEKVLQLIHFKLGSKINKIIEFEIKDTSK